MKTTANTTATKTAATTAVAVDAGWKFTPDSATVLGQHFAASYSVAKSGDVYAFVVANDMPIRLHIAKGSPLYNAAFDAAMTAKQPAKQAEVKPEPVAKPAEQVAPKAEKAVAKQPAKQAEAKPEPAAKQPSVKAPAADKAKAKASLAKGKAERDAAKAAKQPAKPATPAKAAKQPAAKAEPVAKPAKQVPAGDKGWIGTAITGKGWRIVFDDATQRTRVSFDAQPSAKQKAAVEAAGFYFSAQLGSWNKKLTCKAYRAAQALAATLTALS